MTTFNTSMGHFEYFVLPFRLINAPAVLQALVNYVLRDMINMLINMSSFLPLPCSLLVRQADAEEAVGEPVIS